jgi:hypothetical protein
MAEREFYNLNDQISYPLVHGDPVDLSPSGVLPKQGIVDAGFTMGKDSGFVPETDSVYLYSVRSDSDEIQLDFRSGAPGFAGRRFLFIFPAGTPFGATCYADSTLISGGSPDPDKGYGFVTVGDLTEMRALGYLLMFTYLFTVMGILRVEPALIQTEVDMFVHDISLANKARCCPAPCENQSSSSSSSMAMACDPDAIYVLTNGLTGDVLFKEGNNIIIQLDEVNNALLFDAQLGYGLGKSCEDVIVDDDGVPGFRRGEFCLACDEVIRSVNGRTIPEGKLVLSGWPGVVITSDQNSFEVGITLDPEKLCEE